MKSRHSHIASASVSVAPMHRGPQAISHAGIGAAAVVHAPNAALLIDFDNVTMGIRSDLGHELRSLLGSDIIKGKVAVQRAYADWRRYPQYIVPLAESSIDMIMAPAYGSSKKNATDIRLAIDAIELVFTRPEIGTFILLSGDSDFSSLVMKIKEYGKYVIGVGIRESSSDLLVQNCDEYYSYNALAGLVKSGENESTAKHDPWELVTEAIDRMVRNGDVMRSDRLKQVMQEIDGTFDEKNLGISKFSKFCLEAAQKGLLVVNKLENGQLDVAPPSGSARGTPKLQAPARTASAPRLDAPAPLADGEERESRSRRGRRGGRGRNRPERTDASSAITAEHPVVSVAPDTTAADNGPPRDVDRASGTIATTAPPAASDRTPQASTPAPAGVPVARDRTAHGAPANRGDSSIGLTGIRLTRDEAFSLVRDAVAALATGDDAVPSERVRQKAFALLGRDSESLNERNFARILRDAHDGDVVDLRKRGDAFEVAMAGTVASVADQLEVKEAQLTAAAAREKAANTVVAPRGMGHRGAPARGGRGAFAGKPAGPPPNLLLLGVIDDTPVPSADDSAGKAGRRGRARGRKGDAAPESGAVDEKPARTRVPRAKKASTPA